MWRSTRAVWVFLRHEHLAAARAQAEVGGERVNEVYGPDGDRGGGLGHFGAGGTRRVGERDVDADADTVVGEGGEEYEMEDMGGEHVAVEMDGVDKVGGVEARDEEDERRKRMRRRARRRDDERNPNREQGTEQAEGPGRPRSMWWWGPFRRWRLQDATEY